MFRKLKAIWRYNRSWQLGWVTRETFPRSPSPQIPCVNQHQSMPCYLPLTHRKIQYLRTSTTIMCQLKQRKLGCLWTAEGPHKDRWGALLMSLHRTPLPNTPKFLDTLWESGSSLRPLPKLQRINCCQHAMQHLCGVRIIVPIPFSFLPLLPRE